MVEKKETFRKKSKRKSTVKAASTPYKFGEARFTKGSLMIMPKVSSERRDYIPLGYFDSDIVVMDKAFPIYNAEPMLFSVLSSKMKMAWIKTVSGRLKSDYSYSSSICYNTFPFPSISERRKDELTQCTLAILDERAKHSEKTLAELYDPDKMPEGLREAHHQNDLAVERCYRSTPFSSDEERLEYLFKLYEKMIQEEKDKNTLFEKEKKKKKKK
ncbi:type IIL restriction-modification enzyme MmeI [Bernardetia sp.]|uniref:type IIL restriction-modification enzyme MmeI n=1 Tax=Bernardetia sp. TaxID=1937974 RepID=UPI0025C29B3A|nr:type IIL restriction-modification enzyme MmeI [Bernardetia sp.]